VATDFLAAALPVRLCGAFHPIFMFNCKVRRQWQRWLVGPKRLETPSVGAIISGRSANNGIRKPDENVSLNLAEGESENKNNKRL
jgi:hypothetical protein